MRNEIWCPLNIFTSPFFSHHKLAETLFSGITLSDFFGRSKGLRKKEKEKERRVNLMLLVISRHRRKFFLTHISIGQQRRRKNKQRTFPDDVRWTFRPKDIHQNILIRLRFSRNISGALSAVASVAIDSTNRTTKACSVRHFIASSGRTRHNRSPFPVLALVNCTANWIVRYVKNNKCWEIMN